MRFWKSIIFCLLFSLLTFTFYLLPSKATAANEFSVDANVTYDVQASGKTIVTHNITLVNNLSDVYAVTYTLGLENIDAQNILAEDSSGNVLPTDVQKNGDKTDIKVSFPDTVTGKGAQRHFTVSYENGSFAVKTGEIWEISIPRLDSQSNFRSYQLTLKTPISFGLEAYVSPKPATSTSTDQSYIYTFNKDEVNLTGITAGFGQFQVFSFNLSYHLENPLAKNSQNQIALPPDTAFQKVYIQKIEPKPANVTVDSDGNWLALYDLSPRERVDVTVSGAVQIFASFRSFPRPSDKILADNLKETEYWQVNDPQIKALASQLKTPKAIYDYVSTTLKYDFNRVQPNVQRMGAVKALENPNQAICMEFTDLFIAIARAAGIPAREINGYAYTENSQLQPLSLVADVLHSWPEYYDKDKGVWIPIDPTWASTSGGVDYFDKLDLRHFAFVIHGESSTIPYPPGSYKLGPNPQKDVYVSFGQLPSEKISIPSVVINSIRTLPFFSSIYEAKISNPGPVALYSLYPTVYYDSIEKNRDFISVLPPFSNTVMQVTLPFSLLGKSTPNIIEVSIGTTNAQITTNKTQVVTDSLLAISALLIIIVLIILIRLKKIKFGRITGIIGRVKGKIYARFSRKTSQNQSST